MKKLLFRIAGICATLCAPLLIASVAHAASITWNGGGTPVSGSYNVSDTGNWVGGVAPTTGDVMVFPFTVPSAQRHVLNDLAIDTSFGGIQFNGTNSDCGSSPSFSIGGNRLILTGDITDTSTGSCTFNIGMNITLGAPISYTSTSGGYVVFGPVDGLGTLSLGSNALTISGSVAMSLNYKITGSGSLSLSSAVLLDGDNSGYTGPITVTSTGNVSLYNDSSLGATSAGTLVVNGGRLLLCKQGASTSYSEPLTLNGKGVDIGSGVFSGALYSGFCGGGAGGFGVYVPEIVTVSGNITLASDTLISARDSLKLTGGLSGSFSIGTTPESFGSLIVNSSPNTSSTSNGVQGPHISTSTLTDDQSSTALVVGQNEITIVNGKRGVTDVVGTLKGSGNVGILSVYSGAHLAPGQSPGCISSGNLVLSGTYDVELGGLTVCTQYDQTTVTGTVDVSGGTLNVIRYNNMVPRINNSFTIISNDGADAVTGTFTGLAQGSSFTSDGITYTISYTGGSGNDVVLTVTGVAASLGAPNTGFVQLLKSGLILPALAMLSGFAVLGLQTITRKRK